MSFVNILAEIYVSIFILFVVDIPYLICSLFLVHIQAGLWVTAWKKYDKMQSLNYCYAYFDKY